MKHIFFSILIIILCGKFISAQNPQSTAEIAFVGDILLARGVEKKIEKFGDKYPFEKVKNILVNADLTFGNLENPLTDECRKLEKKYSFQAKAKYSKILKSAGFDVLSLANNHSLDCGQVGLFNTFRNLKSQNVKWIGAGKTNLEAQSPIFFEIKNVKIGFIGFTDVLPQSKAKKPSNVALVSSSNIAKKITLMKQKTDVVIVSIHWGTEYNSHPNEAQIELANEIIKAGADVVIGHHPHVLQGFQITEDSINQKKTLIAYSLGNFVFDSPTLANKRVSESVVLKINVNKNGLVKAEVIPIFIEKYRPIVAKSERRKNILESLNSLSEKLNTNLNKGFIEKSANSYSKAIETDLDSDGKFERINLKNNRQNTLQIRHGKKLLWEGVPMRWKPWKLQIADVDGDGINEIIVGVYKPTKFFPKPHNCLFVYGWRNNKAYPKWLGSSLSRPFTDFQFANLDGEKGDELIALETTLKGKKSLGIYRWDSFGFTLQKKRGEWKNIESFEVKNGNISVEADGKNILIEKILKRN